MAHLWKFEIVISELVVGSLLKVSKFQKQIILSSHSPKNQRNFSHFSALASKKSWKIVQTQDESTKVLIWCYWTQWNSFIALIRPLLKARAKNVENFVGFFGQWEDKIICFRNLLTFRTSKQFLGLLPVMLGRRDKKRSLEVNLEIITRSTEYICCYLWCKTCLKNVHRNPS